MTDIRTAAMQKALEALEFIESPLYVREVSKIGAAIAALRTALEQEQGLWPPSAEWTPCVKLPVTVHVRQQRPGETHVSTREGITPVKPDDLIMRGVSGEEYPIGREIFEKTYRVGDAPVEQDDDPTHCPVCGEIDGGTQCGMQGCGL